MLGPGPRTSKDESRASDDWRIPDEMRHRVAPWIGSEGIGPKEFWTWLATVLPLLPGPTGPSPEPSERARDVENRTRELARDLVDCARDRARLTLFADRYFRDNQVLSVRLKALEATVKTFRETRGLPPSGADEEADQAAERYLPGTSPR
jgi:hypothetical protein